MHRQRHPIVVIAFAVLVHCLAPTYGQGLEAKLAGAKLPTPLYLSTAVYDGTDNVYIFGGNTGTIGTADILCYSISVDKIEKVSSLSTPDYRGIALQSNDGKTIYYFGGTSYPSSIYNFNRETNVTVRLRTILPSYVFFGSGFSINGSHFIFSGRDRSVLEFSEEFGVGKYIGDLPFQVDTSTVASTTAIPNGQDGVWLFAGNSARATNPVLRFNVTTKDVDSQVANTTSLPTLYEGPVSVSDGRNGYLIGGLGRLRENDGSYYPTNGILRVDLNDASTKFLPVASFPAANRTTFDYTSAVYVQKLNRIYIFGGLIATKGVHDSIWYIDLTLPPLPQFDCSNLTHGSYPHPSDCSSFFVCVDGELAGNFTCPSPLLFDPIQQTCTKADLAHCFLSCEGKEGLLPHPTDCSKFLFCTKGSPTIEVFDCPEPLLFDPEHLKCDLPQFVHCKSF